MTKGATVRDATGLVLTALSLIVALVALLLAWQAYTRPAPADPTLVPTLGTPREPFIVSSAEKGWEVLAFVEQNSGKKVRLTVDLDSAYFRDGPANPELDPSENGFGVPGENCASKPVALVSTRDCLVEALEVLDVSNARPGMYYEHGTWKLHGYFASNGYINIFMGQNIYSVVPLTPVEAVG